MKAAKDKSQNVMQAVCLSKSINVSGSLQVRAGLYRFAAKADTTIIHSEIPGDGVFIPAGMTEYFYIPKGTLTVTGEINLMGDYE